MNDYTKDMSNENEVKHHLAIEAQIKALDLAIQMTKSWWSNATTIYQWMRFVDSSKS